MLASLLNYGDRVMVWGYLPDTAAAPVEPTTAPAKICAISMNAFTVSAPCPPYLSPKNPINPKTMARMADMMVMPVIEEAIRCPRDCSVGKGLPGANSAHA